MKSTGAALAGMMVGLALGAVGLRATVAQAPLPLANPQENRVLANLYMQSAGEYRACCLQTYKWAAERLAVKLNAAPGGKPPAVVMDLDETVLDNSGFQEFLYRNRLNYKDALWEPWERDFADEVGLIPGAKEFIATAEKAGVTVVYISNRMQKYRTATTRALQHNGLNVENLDSRLLLKDTTSDKSARRAIAAERFTVLMYFGDNLRDFSEEFKVLPAKTTVASRAGQVDAALGHWGDDWIVLPNPSYGEWERLLHANPADDLRPTKMKLTP